MLSSPFRLRGSRRLSELVLDSLGELERKVLDQVRLDGETTVSRMCDAFGNQYAYTTVMTTLDRLFKKGLLERRKEGRAFLYSSRYSPEEIERGVADDVIAQLLDIGAGRAEPVLACIVERISERDATLLDELDRLVQEKRRQLQSTGD
jgi:predicted transcriptional regulator